MPPKRRSEAVAGGYVSREVAKNTAHAGVRIAELAATILRDVTDGDNDVRTTIAASAELAELAAYISDTQWNVADGNYPDARAMSQNLISDVTTPPQRNVKGRAS